MFSAYIMNFKLHFQQILLIPNVFLAVPPLERNSQLQITDAFWIYGLAQELLSTFSFGIIFMFINANICKLYL